MTTSDPTTPLVPVPRPMLRLSPGGQGKVEAFSSLRWLAVHACHHPLTAEEAWGWAVLLDGYATEVGGLDCSSRQSLAKTFWMFGSTPHKDVPPRAAWVVEGYLREAERAMWCGSRWITKGDKDGQVKWTALGLNGVKVTWLDAGSRVFLLTAMLPRFTSWKKAGKTVPTYDKPLPREWKGTPRQRPSCPYGIYEKCCCNVKRGETTSFGGGESRTPPKYPPDRMPLLSETAWRRAIQRVTAS